MVLGAVGLCDISNWIDYALFVRLLSRRFDFVLDQVKKPPTWSFPVSGANNGASRSVRESTKAASLQSRLGQAKRQECPLIRKTQDIISNYNLRSKGLFRDSEFVSKNWLRSAFGVFRDKIVWDRSTRFSIYERDSDPKKVIIARKKKGTTKKK